MVSIGAGLKSMAKADLVFSPAVAFGGMLAGVLAVYCPLALADGDSTLFGMDFLVLHLRRMEFARESLDSLANGLPGWYPREFLGSPFWSNIQSFPWIPTRLVLFMLDPAVAYPLGVNLAALLAATFTWLFGRSLGWGPWGAAIAGWTFAVSGFFAARVTAGHLPLLEAYPALPLLLWLVERTFRDRAGAGSLALLALGSAVVVVAGHPQLPAYAVACALLYLFWVGMERYGAPWRPLIDRTLAIGLGIGVTLVVWWPMLQLLGRSTRILGLERASNDLALPYARLPALLLPWRDGWPAAVDRLPAEPFSGFSRTSYFWDTVGYVGLLPWIAVLVLCFLWVRGSQRPTRRGAFFVVLAPASILLALPWVQDVGSLLPGTWLRSPSRLLYLTTFSLSLALGLALDRFLRGRWPGNANTRLGLAVAAVAFHVLDLSAHARPFVRTHSSALIGIPDISKVLAEEVGDARVAVDYDLPIDLNRRYDDLGFFDSVILARPYAALLALEDRPASTNFQSFRASELSESSLRNLGVAFVLSLHTQADLPPVVPGKRDFSRVPDPTPRALFFPESATQWLPENEILEQFRSGVPDFGARLSLPGRAEPDANPASGGSVARVDYRRLSPGRIEVRVDAPVRGFVRLLETWDPGWHATVDGRPTKTLAAETFLIAVPVDAGVHTIEVRYRTPGARVGAAMSIASTLLLVALLWRARARPQPSSAANLWH